MLIVGNVVSALAPTYLVLLLSRMLIPFAHGVFWSTTPAAEMRLVAPKDEVRAIAVDTVRRWAVIAAGRPA